MTPKRRVYLALLLALSLCCGVLLSACEPESDEQDSDTQTQTEQQQDVEDDADEEPEQSEDAEDDTSEQPTNPFRGAVVATQAGEPPATEALDVVAVVDSAGASVVAINVTIEGQRMNPFQTPPQQRGGGSGFVINDSDIVTNFHVVGAALQQGGLELAEGAELTVSFAGTPDERYPITVVGANPDYDLALLRLESADDMPEGTMPLVLADSDQLQVGQPVVAIGNPFGLQSTVTTGIVSAVERERPSIVGIEIPFIQTDAAINPGNSGGPLLNARGELIGINNAILSPSGTFAGIGFAVPSNLLRDDLETLQSGGLSGLAAAVADSSRPSIGLVSQLSVSDYPEELREELGLPDQGAIITAIAADSPAAEAGLQEPRIGIDDRGRTFPRDVDIITQIGGEPVEDVRDIQRAVVDREVGDTVTLTVWRSGDTREVDVTLEQLSN